MDDLPRSAQPVCRHPRYDDLLALVALAAVTVGLVRLGLYPGGRPWDRFVDRRACCETRPTGRAVCRRRWSCVGFNALLWQRASSATSRDLNFFGVGVTFRTGLLLLLLFGALASRAPRRLGRLAACGSTSRSGSQRSPSVGSRRRRRRRRASAACYPPRRLVQTLLAVAGAIGVSWLALACLHPGRASAGSSGCSTRCGRRSALADRARRFPRPACSNRCFFWLERVITDMLRRGDPAFASRRARRRRLSRARTCWRTCRAGRSTWRAMSLS